MTTQIEGNYRVKGWDWEKRHYAVLKFVAVLMLTKNQKW
jgi:hypothetical protein